MRITLHLKAELDRKLVDALRRSLEPEMKHLPTGRFKGKTVAKEDTLHIYTETTDLTALRASINSYIRYMSVCYRSIETLKEENRGSYK